MKANKVGKEMYLFKIVSTISTNDLFCGTKSTNTKPLGHKIGNYSLSRKINGPRTGARDGCKAELFWLRYCMRYLQRLFIGHWNLCGGILFGLKLRLLLINWRRIRVRKYMAPFDWIKSMKFCVNFIDF